MNPPVVTGAAPALATHRFPVGALERREGYWGDKSQALTASAVTLDTFDVPAGGFVRGLYLDIVSSGSSGAATFAADGPWSLISDLTVMDPDGTPIIGPLTGFDLYQINLLAGVTAYHDPVNSIGYTASTASGAFAFRLYIPFEMNGRDAIGALRNGASNSTLKVRITQAGSASVYSSAPATLPTGVRYRMSSDLWVRPSSSLSPSGRQYADRPMGDGAYQMWTKQSYAINSGLNTIPIRRLGNFYRELILTTRDASAVRSSSIITPDTAVRLMYEGNELYNDTFGLLQWITQQRTRLATASIPTGTFVYDWIHEFDGEIGGELRDQWLPTLPGTRLELQFTAGAAGTLTVLTNDVYVPAGSPLIP